MPKKAGMEKWKKSMKDIFDIIRLLFPIPCTNRRFFGIFCKKRSEGEHVERIYRRTGSGHCQLHHRLQCNCAADGETVWDIEEYGTQRRHRSPGTHQPFAGGPDQNYTGYQQGRAPHPRRHGHPGEISASAAGLQPGRIEEICRHADAAERKRAVIVHGQYPVKRIAVNGVNSVPVVNRE